MAMDKQWLETIHICSLKAITLDLKDRLQKIIENAEEKWPGKEIELFQHSKLTYDFFIVIRHRTDAMEARGSKLGLHIAWQAKEYGYISHAVWLIPPN